GVRDRVGIGVAGEPQRVRDLDAAEDQLATRGEAVRVVPDPDAHAGSSPVVWRRRNSGFSTGPQINVHNVHSAQTAHHTCRMRIASKAAFFALSIPTVATGTPLGSCAVASSASSPFKGPAANGTPITGRSVSEAANPGRAADSPAPAMMNLNPCPLAPDTRLAVCYGWRCDEDTTISYETPSLLC